MKALPEQKQIRKLWSRIRGNIMENRRFQWLLSLVVSNGIGKWYIEGRGSSLRGNYFLVYGDFMAVL